MKVDNFFFLEINYLYDNILAILAPRVMEFSVLVHHSLPKLLDDFKRKAVTRHFSAQNYLLLGRGGGGRVIKE